VPQNCSATICLGSILLACLPGLTCHPVPFHGHPGDLCHHLSHPSPLPFPAGLEQLCVPSHSLPSLPLHLQLPHDLPPRCYHPTTQHHTPTPTYERAYHRAVTLPAGSNATYRLAHVLGRGLPDDWRTRAPYFSRTKTVNSVLTTTRQHAISLSCIGEPRV